MSQTEVQLIKDSVIVNADISGSAAIAASKISGTVSAATTATTSTNVTVADESSDTTCFPLFATAATGDLPLKSGSNLTFNSNTGVLTATSFAGDGSNLTGVTSVGGDTGVDFNDGVKARFGTGNDLVIEHDGSNSYISDNGTGDLIISGSVVRLKSANTTEDMIKATENGAVALYHDNSEKLSTQSTGVLITGKMTATTLSVDDNADTSMDSSASGQLQFGGNGYTGAIALDGSNMNIYHNASGRGIVFGINETAVAKFDTSGNFLPATNNAKNLGSSSLRWANIFTNDLNLSNEGSSNDVDGTWGDWTIQEGESELFLKNNRSGKKYKFNLTEVS
jgi:hypothetical protein